MTRAQHTMEQLRLIADSVYPFLRFTVDGFVDSPIPVLDTQFWVGAPSSEGAWYQKDEGVLKCPPPAREGGGGGRRGSHTPVPLLQEAYGAANWNPLQVSLPRILQGINCCQ